MATPHICGVMVKILSEKGAMTLAAMKALLTNTLVATSSDKTYPNVLNLKLITLRLISCRGTYSTLKGIPDDTPNVLVFDDFKQG